ncbi:MAG: SCO family protein [Bdellovibrionales bacterium]
MIIAQLLFTSVMVWSANNAPKPYSAEAEPLAATEVPEQIRNVGIKEQLGKKIDLNLGFVDENGKSVTLAQYLSVGRPLIISPVYYSCPGLCNFHLNGLVDGLKGLDWSVGQKFDVAAISFDSKETPELAKDKKANYMKSYGRPGTESGFHFLTATEDVIQNFTSSVGFEFKWNDQSKEWSHASAAIIISPDGTISRYLPGIVFEPKNIKLAVNEASEGKVGTLMDSLILYCFQYNPHKSEYTLAAFQIMKLGAVLMIIVLAIWLIPFWIRSIRSKSKV